MHLVHRERPVDHGEALGIGAGELEELLAHRLVEGVAGVLESVPARGAALVEGLRGHVQQDRAMGEEAVGGPQRERGDLVRIQLPAGALVGDGGVGVPVGDDDLAPVEGRADHPVTQVSHRDAVAYATWVGGRLPTETEWEYAARGGLDQQPYPWGSEREPGGTPRMQTFHGTFPDQPTAPVGTEAAAAFPPNGFGLHTMTGNVWEWTSSPFAPGDDRPVLRGGSYLCHASYCRRYRTSARTASTPDTSLGHTGLRIAVTTGQDVTGRTG